MSFKATVYFNDEDIYSTKITAKSGTGDTIFSVTKRYGNSAYTTEEVPDSTMMTFEAIPDDGCEFDRWYYRIGDEIDNDDISPRESTDNPFYYSGTEDIVIRAAGEVDSSVPDTWNWNYHGSFTLDLVNNPSAFVEIEIEPKTLHIVSFKYSGGKIKVFTEGSVDTYGYVGPYLPRVSYWELYDAEKGKPFYVQYEDDDSNGGGNFLIDGSPVEVSNSGNLLWIKSYDGIETGTTYVYIENYEDEVTVRPWDWFSANSTADENAEATAIQTENAYNAVCDRQPTTNFSHKVWMDMVSKVKEITKHSSGYWDSADYASYDDTKNLPQNDDGQYELTAIAFNSLRNNLEIAGLSNKVNLGYRTGIGRVIPGNEVDGDYFLTLANYMNDCIDVINSS